VAAIEAAAATANLIAGEIPAAAADVIATEPPVTVDSGDAPPIAEDATPAPSANLLPDIAFSPATIADEPASVEASAIEVEPEPAAPAEAVATDAPQDPASAEPATETVAAADAALVETATVAAASDAVAAPEMVEVWRPGGRSEERRPRHDRSRHRHQGHQDKPQEARRRSPRRVKAVRPPKASGIAADGATAAISASPAPTWRPKALWQPLRRKARPFASRARTRAVRPRERFQGRERDKGRDSDKGREGDRPKGKFEGKFGGGRDKGSRDKGGRDKGGRDSGPSHRQYATSAAPRERERPVDPNSPFAKLAALKEQLTANRKDR